ncbi:probable plastid-lipid-associated protein 12, chloroplastic isoform X2 [Arachis ipaensis]|uniref:Putative plastid-lipid-associated protein n=1 Tax=Arachis hypogaea TaxID=3818 RepID=A0A6B9VGF3_ARAHY|nr:probable plastid-lipid-associated protein 12, chloroplastic isoform X2 [Arachis ipaensis]XP_025676211.1 probable plastid-lipid-associated protein 12, chloroplastic isoform X2 [Arachis hypogaea]QHN79288.1 putative plastid-lipid-associated protein [Arachis hypogaea]
MAVKAVNLGFQFPSSTPLSFGSSSPKLRKDRLVFRSSTVEQISFTESENSLIEALLGIQGRGRSSSPNQLNAVERAVQVLERLGGVPDPTKSNLIEGRWQLIFTTRPGTASPIQAAASIQDGKRILFRFDRAAFSFRFLPFKVPYPVPFRLLGDEAKGWLDTTYLSHSGNLRISRGNKGTTFVLQKQTEPRQRLLTAVSSGRNVKEAIEELVSLTRNNGEKEPELEEGEWQMVWNSQTVTDSWIENAANGLMGKQIIGKNGRIKFVVDILLGLKFSMTGNFVKTGTKMYDVTMDDAAIIGGPFGYPMQMENKFTLELLYSDEKIRITRGYNEILFVHTRTDASRMN